MNRIPFIVFVSLGVILSGAAMFAQEKPAPEKTPKVTIRVKTKGDFVGTVSHVDTAGKTIAVKNKGMAVTFDVGNPMLKGYKSLEQIKPGDKIAISYTGDGARIARVTGTHSLQQEEIEKVKPAEKRPKQETVKNSTGRPVRIRERTKSVEFRDVDNNNDGRITPVELSAVLPNLTVQDFKKFDRNNDGSLNEPEYNAIKSSATRNR